MQQLFSKRCALALTSAALLCAPLFAQDTLQAPGKLQAPIVQVDYDHTAPLNKIKTYTWGKVQASDPRLEPRITAAVDNVLQGEGFKLVSKNPDIVLDVVDAAKDSREYEQFYKSIAQFNSTRGWGGGGFSNSDATLAQIAVGTLVLDVYDAKTDRLVWRATAVEPPENKQRKMADDIDKAVARMFVNFPPKSAGPLAPNNVEVPGGSCNQRPTSNN